MDDYAPYTVFFLFLRTKKSRMRVIMKRKVRAPAKERRVSSALVLVAISTGS